MCMVAGFLLVSAALLKVLDLVSGPTVAETASPLSAFLVTCQIGVEMSVGLLLFSGHYWRTLHWVAVILFSGFAAYSLHLALIGAASCDCFGPVHVHPWWTFLLDLGVVFGILLPLRCYSNKNIKSGALRLVPDAARPRNVVLAIVGFAIIAVALLVRSVDRRTAIAESVLLTTGDWVILQPEKWIGQTLPIANFIDIDLSSGRWTALLHRHDCPACQEALPRYEQLASTGEKVALIDVPPYGKFGLRERACRYGRLKDDRDWFVQTPVEIRLQDGIVTAIAHGE
jgi:hypothetical protein